jgi:hypothetical protein
MPDDEADSEYERTRKVEGRNITSAKKRAWTGLASLRVTARTTLQTHESARSERPAGYLAVRATLTSCLMPLFLLVGSF